MKIATVTSNIEESNLGVNQAPSLIERIFKVIFVGFILFIGVFLFLFFAILFPLFYFTTFCSLMFSIFRMTIVTLHEKFSSK